ncbi:T3SS effector HopA1 family protein [Nocardiopsis mangrovi]|uniref:T3SS effector HopA1 family protein n=1 Tax=Nocardiopsis mangrovi TaxID=1179818 RepID=A0ABV9E2T5_9ACTN
MSAVGAGSLVSPALLAALDAVRVDPAGTGAEVLGRSVTAGHPGELPGRLSGALYSSLHSGGAADDGDVPFRLRTPELDRGFARAVPHRRSYEEVTVCDTADVADPADASRVLVLRGGVRTWVPAEDIVDARGAEPGARVRLAVPALRPAVSPGFFMVTGSRPETADPHRLRLYLHVADPESATEVWRAVLEALEAGTAGYRAKVLSSAALYPRRDAIVVYLAGAERDVPALLAERVSGLPGLGAETSAFAHRIAPGAAVAWEPADPRPEMRGLSFGQHRAVAVARAVVTSAVDGLARERALADALTAAGIDPADPSRNLDSPPNPNP